MEIHGRPALTLRLALEKEKRGLFTLDALSRLRKRSATASHATPAESAARVSRDQPRASYLVVVVLEWLGTESNRRHADFQSAALPTELPSREPHKLTAPHTPFNPFRRQGLSDHLAAASHRAAHAKQTLTPPPVSISSPFSKI